tara:strand:- start:233 stop:550 length:318 start_codon:yes stop_codon:yes gene_type:complete
MCCKIDDLPVKFRESLINNFSKNINYTIIQLYKQEKEDKKIGLLNQLINRLNGYEGEIILKYNKNILFRLLNNLNNFIRDKKTKLFNDNISNNINFIIKILNENN